ncbi:hypothetical protein DV736_g377, partial [Chaetothyriales sp. CBS 134916]
MTIRTIDPDVWNEPAPGVPFFTPKQHTPHGTGLGPQSDDSQLDDSRLPKLFQLLNIRSLTLQNRIFLSPLCQYSANNGGWPHDVWDPSPIPYSLSYPTPKAYTLDKISALKDSFAAAVGRAAKAGFDAIEIHAAHGYLLHEFVSPVTNQRTDQYGGSFENRTRLLLEIVDAMRAAIPTGTAQFVRTSATDWLDVSDDLMREFPESWTLDQSIKLAGILADRGVDLLDVSTGGLHSKQQVKEGPAYQALFARAIKKSVGDKLLVTAVGAITDGKLANELVEDDGIDAVFVGRCPRLGNSPMT